MLGTRGMALLATGWPCAVGRGRCHFGHLEVSSGRAINVRGAWLCTQSCPVVPDRTLSWSLVPALDWGAGGCSGREMGATSGICPSHWGWGVAVLCPVDPVRQCWGSGQTPNPDFWPHLRPGCLGHLGSSADSLPVRFTLPGQLRWAIITAVGAGNREGTQLCQHPAPLPQGAAGDQQLPLPWGASLGCQEGREGVSGAGGISAGGVGRQPLP